MTKIGDSTLSRSQWVALIFALLPILLIYAWLSSTLKALYGFDQLDIFSTLVTGTLSLVLIVVYIRQNDILKAQTTILRAEHRPVISFVSRSIGVTSPSSVETEKKLSKDHIQLELQNSGNETALNLRLYCFVEYEGDTNQPIASNTVALNQPESGSNTIESRGGVLPADNVSQTFYSFVEYENLNYGWSVDTNEKEVPYTIAISNLFGLDGENYESLQEQTNDQDILNRGEVDEEQTNCEDGTVRGEAVSTVTIGFLVLFDNTVGDTFAVGINPAYHLEAEDVDSTVSLEQLEDITTKKFLETVVDDDFATELGIDESNLRL